jgi:uncharacterized membrane protein
MNEQQLARGLGWFSIGLGLAELLAPRKVAAAIGVSDHDELLRTMGLREITSGIGILSQARPSANWVWSRVAGDVMDLSMLGSALGSETNDRRRVTTAIVAVAGVTVLDTLCSVRLSQQESRRNRAQLPRDRNGRALGLRSGKVTRKSITINRSPEEIYAFWRNFENLPRFMNHLKAVTVTGEGHSHWVAKGPVGTEVEWDAEVIADEPNELIAWRSLPGSTVENAGTVRFERATGGRGTVVRVDLQYRPPAGALGATIAKLFGQSPEKQIPVDLMRIKQLLETGEITRTEGQAAGRARSTSRKFDDLIRA